MRRARHVTGSEKGPVWLKSVPGLQTTLPARCNPKLWQVIDYSGAQHAPA